VLHHDEKLVEQAVSEAIESNVISKTHIVNRLSRLLDAPPPAALEPPPGLSLSMEYSVAISQIKTQDTVI